MTDALSELSGQPPVDPEKQAVITDFIDYTEFFPSDLFRSLSLMRKQDELYQDDASAINSLTKTYGNLPNIPHPERPNPRSLRRDISRRVEHGLRCRESSAAEATRVTGVIDVLHHRLTAIVNNLKAKPLPLSRDPTLRLTPDLLPQPGRGNRRMTVLPV